ncbi:hypothetical protein QTO34_004018 [Cnephaeus nilssonii]|uniref:B30.2/SPRY domain-containing protein n=1 Tax=Cnephaeus nilssonii TaxID=3371016 RepID=A0AA40HRX2_CNENI|nr:hypothetical protein QTO34_004018 [Eptesicus nilssonii]
MAHKRQLLRGMYTELKEMCHKPDVELLLVRTQKWGAECSPAQAFFNGNPPPLLWHLFPTTYFHSLSYFVGRNFGDILHRSEAVCVHMPQPVKAELTAVTIPGMIARFNPFQRAISVCHGRAHNHEFLEEDLISLNIGWGVYGAPLPFPKSECFLYLGASIFTYGQHYWELEVGDTWNWALGVCCDDWIKNNINLHKAFYLLGCAKNNMHHSVFTTSPSVLQYVPKPIGRVGVFLDYEGRSVTFILNLCCKRLGQEFPT